MKPTLRLTVLLALLIQAISLRSSSYAGGRLWSLAGSQGSGRTAPLPNEPLSFDRLNSQLAGSVEGHVTDANTAQPLPNANVYLSSNTDPAFEASTWTDSEGYYSLGSLLPADYELRAAAYGYYSGNAELTIVQDTALIQDFALDAAIPELSPHAVGVDVVVNRTDLYSLTLANYGAGGLHFHISELPVDTPAGGSLLPGEMSADIDPQLYTDLADSTDGTVTFVVYMAEQADLSGAFLIKDRSARGYYVLNLLRATAGRTQAGLRAELAKAGVEYEPRTIVNALVVKGNLSLVERVATRPEVAYIGANNAVPAPNPVEAQASTEGVETVEWNIHRVRADEVWTGLGTRGEGIVVASIDTGVEYLHPALVAQYRGNLGAGSFDHNHNWWDPYGYGPTVPYDYWGHGTHTMGTMVGDDGAGNQIGMAPGATWFTCQGFDRNTNYGYEAELLECAEFVLAPWDLSGANPDPDRRADVVNNSWGGGQAQWWYNQVVYAWRAAGILPSFSAGNGGPGCNTAGDPGDMANVIAVGATDRYDSNAPLTTARFSSRGPAMVSGLVKPDVSAPGAGIRSSVLNKLYGISSGTSMASPHVAGEAALIWAAQPDLRGNVQLTYWIIEQSADRLPVNQGYDCGSDSADSIPNNQYGWGRIDAYEAVSMAVHTNWDVPWLAAHPVSGTVPPGDDTAIELAFDTAGLTEGQCYNARLKIEYNDPYVVEEFVPVTLCVSFCLEVDSVAIVGPDWLFLDQQGTYSATATPVTATLPVIFEWSNGATGTASAYGWATTGTHTVVVTATNCEGSSVTDTLGVSVLRARTTLYLPVFFKNY
jgi:subtilisin family serine protease